METKIFSISDRFFNIIPKPEQVNTIKSYLSGHDTILIAPTGYGKSLLYQIAPLLFNETRYEPTAALHQHHHYPSFMGNSHTNYSSNTSTSSWRNTSNVSDKVESLAGGSEGEVFATTSSSTPLRPVRITEEATGDDDEEVGNLSKDFHLLDISLTPIKVVPPPATTTHSSTITTTITTDVTTTRVTRFAQFLIIMPLVALIEDAMKNVRKLTPQISAVHLCTATTEQAKSSVFIFTSPESIIDGTARKLLQSMLNIKAVFIDEFHVIESWGSKIGKAEAFRSAYGQLGQLRAFIQNTPFICLSATATQGTITNVKSSLVLNNPKIIKISINKENITYHTLDVKGSVIQDFRWLCDVITATAPTELPRIVIFFNNINRLIDAYQYVTVSCEQKIGAEFPSVVMFHLITDPIIKERVLSDLGSTSGVIKAVFCSSSLSMGLNLADIEYVIHYGPPTTLCAFIQESGRAAREIASHGHSILLKFPRMAAGRKLDDSMKEYCKGQKCLRNILLAKFSSRRPLNQKLCCDVCDSTVPCPIKLAIADSFESSITDSFSDSLSIGSLGDVEDIDI